MQNVISKQRGFSCLVNLAGHQAGHANRIAYFSSLMVTTADETEFNMARSQVGKTISKMRNAHKILRAGDPENGIPKVTNDNLKMIFQDPSVGLDRAIERFLNHANDVYLSHYGKPHRGFHIPDLRGQLHAIPRKTVSKRSMDIM
jgi:hypothetical protein